MDDSQNSRTMDSTQTLARVSPSRAAKFLTTWANLRGDSDSVAFLKNHFGALLPAWRPPGQAPPIITGAKVVGTMTLEVQEIQHLVRLRDALRVIWCEPDLRTKEWGAILLRRETWKAAGYFDGNWPQGLPHPLPQPTPFEQSLVFLLKAADRARYCGNPDCVAPYFFAKRRSQKYCSDACSLPAQREFKRQWWADKGRAERKARRRAKAKARARAKRQRGE